MTLYYIILYYIILYYIILYYIIRTREITDIFIPLYLFRAKDKCETTRKT